MSSTIHRVLLAFVLASFLCTCEKEPENLQPSIIDQIDPAFDHAYLATELLPNGTQQLHHVYLSSRDVFDGELLHGVSTRALQFSFLHKGNLPAGTYNYQLGTNYGEETIDFFDLGYYSSYNFDEVDNGSTHAPFNAKIDVRYEGEQMLLSVTTTISGQEVTLADYEGTPQRVDLSNLLQEDLELPVEGEENLVEMNGKSFVPTQAILVMPEGRFGNIRACTARLLLGTGNVTPNLRFLDSRNHVHLTFRGRGMAMEDGLFAVKKYSRDFRDRFGLLNTSFSSTIKASGDDGLERDYPFKGRGEIIAYVQGDRLVVRGKATNHAGEVIKVTYTGDVERVEQIFD